MDEQTATEQLLALELAREDRRLRRNRVLRWLAVLLVVAAVIGVPVSINLREQARQDAIRDEMFCDMVGAC